FFLHPSLDSLHSSSLVWTPFVAFLTALISSSALATFFMLWSVTWSPPRAVLGTRKGVRTLYRHLYQQVLCVAGPSDAACSPGLSAAPRARPIAPLHTVDHVARCAAGPPVLPRFAGG